MILGGKKVSFLFSPSTTFFGCSTLPCKTFPSFQHHGPFLLKPPLPPSELFKPRPRPRSLLFPPPTLSTLLSLALMNPKPSRKKSERARETRAGGRGKKNSTHAPIGRNRRYSHYWESGRREGGETLTCTPIGGTRRHFHCWESRSRVEKPLTLRLVETAATLTAGKPGGGRGGGRQKPSVTGPLEETAATLTAGQAEGESGGKKGGGACANVWWGVCANE